MGLMLSVWLMSREELCLEMGEYLSARYPMVYSVERRTGKAGSWFNEPNEIRLIKIKPLGVEFDLDKEDPMMVAGLLTPVDLAIMMEGEDSLYYMRGGCIALAGSWRYEDKSESPHLSTVQWLANRAVGRDLYAIHTTGEVPECKCRVKDHRSSDRQNKAGFAHDPVSNE